MPLILSDIVDTFKSATDADPLTVLLPLVIVAIANGLRSDGPGQLLSAATRGLFGVGALNILISGLMDESRTSLDAWGVRLADAWDQLMVFKVGEALGFWLLLLAVSVLIFVVRSFVRR